MNLGPAVALGSLVLLSVAAARAEGPPAAPASPNSRELVSEAAPPARAKVTCAEYRRRVAATAPHAAFDTRLKPGAWGAIPPALRRLPPGAHLCGADSHGQAVVTSPLYGKKLEEHYARLFAKLDFQPLECRVANGQTICSGKHGRDVGVLVTDATSQVFVISLMKRPRPTPLLAAH